MALNPPSGPPQYLEHWRFRVEAYPDVIGLKLPGYPQTDGWLRSFHWARHGIYPLRISLWRQSAERPDMEGELVLASEDPASMIAGLNALVDTIEAQRDTHTLIETLKLAAHYDGLRNGPFAHGQRLRAKLVS